MRFWEEGEKKGRSRKESCWSHYWWFRASVASKLQLHDWDPCFARFGFRDA
jgi:hypothetical protein